MSFGGSAPGFASVNCGAARKAGACAGEWPLPVPECELSVQPNLAADGAQPAPVHLAEDEFAGIAWMLNGRAAAQTRRAVRSECQARKRTAFQLCCAALCGKNTGPPSS